MSDYRTADKILAFLACKTCGTRPFIITSDLVEEKADADGSDVDKLAAQIDSMGIEDIKGVTKEKGMRVWRPVMGEWDKKEDDGTYFSLNGHTIDAGQEGFEMRDYVDNKTVEFLDWLHDRDAEKKDKPHAGGSY